MNIQKLITETEERLHFLKSLLTKIKFTPKSKKRKPIKPITILKPIIPNTIIKKADIDDHDDNVRNTFIIIDNKHNVDLDMNHLEDDYRKYEYYDGEMCNDLRHGQGKLYKYSKDAHYECDENKKRHSERIYTEKIIYTEKVDYEGEWVNGLRNGHGKSYGENGKLIYEGYWKNDLKHGQGKDYKYGKLIYEGNWENGLEHGWGKLYERGKLIYEGYWKNGLYNGIGKLYECGKLIYEGDWKNGLYHGDGKHYINGQLIYKGRFNHHLRDGNGKSYNMKGQIENEGMWYNDRMVHYRTIGICPMKNK